MTVAWTLGGPDGGVRGGWIGETFEGRSGRRMLHSEERACVKTLRRTKHRNLAFILHSVCICHF